MRKWRVVPLEKWFAWFLKNILGHSFVLKRNFHLKIKPGFFLHIATTSSQAVTQFLELQTSREDKSFDLIQGGLSNPSCLNNNIFLSVNYIDTKVSFSEPWSSEHYCVRAGKTSVLHNNVSSHSSEITTNHITSHFIELVILNVLIK